jgi:signal peptidase I
MTALSRSVGPQNITPDRQRPVVAAGRAHRTGLRVIAAVALCALAAVLASVTAPRLLGCQTMVIRSGSMGTAVPVGSVAVGCPRSAAQIRVGDVILLRDPARDGHLPVLHRVTSIQRHAGSQVVQTKGDANPHPDPHRRTLDDQVVVHRYAVPYAGYVLGYGSTPAGWLLLALSAAAALLPRSTGDAWRTMDRTRGGADPCQ